MSKFEITKLGELMLREMAVSWVNNEVFSELHITPYRKEAVFQVFPAAREAMCEAHVKREVESNCGFIFELMALRVPDKTVRFLAPGMAPSMAIYLPLFHTVRFFHKEQRPGLQKMIEEERLRLKWLAKQNRRMPGPKYKY